MSDSDESDETPDFSVLLNKNRRKGKLTRGVKDFEPHPSSTQDIAVANARNALFQVIGEEKKPNKKSTSAGIFDSSTGLTTVIQNKGTHLHTMGHTQNGKIMLYPEEAAWLLSRSALIATDIHNTPCPMAAYYQFMFGRGDGWITYEKYQVYAYLKRLGYIVLRSRPSDPVRSTYLETIGQKCWQFWRTLARVILSVWESIGSWKSTRPLVCNYQSGSYNSLYSTLQIIPSGPGYKPFQSVQMPRSFSWDVYKPNPRWKKREPGMPDFRITVQSIQDMPLSLTEYGQLSDQVVPTCSGKQPSIRHTKYGGQCSFLVALVDDVEGVTFLRVATDGLADISIGDIV